MRTFLIPAILVSGACASAGTPPVRSGTQTIEVVGSGAGSIRITPNTDAMIRQFAFPIDRVWAVLPAAFDSLAIPVSMIDSARRIIGNGGFKLRQRLGKIALSRYMDCGTTQIGPNADSYDVYLTVLTELQPGASGTMSMSTTFEAMARPITFAQAYSSCASRGVLESRLVDVARALLKS